ncbi:MAG TPA: HesA/MoeB/ThiF family protein [Candidatus Dormibacteraeota bacterium]
MSEGELTEDELLRYSRQIVLREVGGRGQLRLRSASIAIVGAGGLGSPAVLYLAAAGAGRLTIIDDDTVALDNLQRQVLHDSAALGEPKAQSARRRVAALNPEVSVRTVEQRLDGANAVGLLAGHDVVLDGSDNFSTKFAVNDACVRLGICAVIGGVIRFEGQVVVVPPGAPCYRCLFGEEPAAGLVPSCRAAGVLGAVAGMVGCLQASEALRHLLGAGDDQAGRVLLLDALRPRLRSVPFPRDPGCRACAESGITTGR